MIYFIEFAKLSPLIRLLHEGTAGGRTAEAPLRPESDVVHDPVAGPPAAAAGPVQAGPAPAAGRPHHHLDGLEVGLLPGLVEEVLEVQVAAVLYPGGLPGTGTKQLL